MSREKRFAISCSHLRASRSGGVSLDSTTFPLCKYVRTSSKPAPASSSRSSPIATLLRRPRLMPRKSTICRAMLSAGAHGVAQRDRAVFQDVGSKTTTVHELTQDGPRGIALDHGARLVQSHPPASRASDRELVAHQRIEVDPPGDDVAAVLIG